MSTSRLSRSRRGIVAASLRRRSRRARRCMGFGSGRSRADLLDVARRGVDGRRRSPRRAAVRSAVRRRHAQRHGSTRDRLPPLLVGGDDCGRGSPLLRAPRRRSRSRCSRAARRNVAERPGRRRRIDDHAAGRRSCCSSARRRRQRSRGLRAKLHEAVLALRLEHRLHEARDPGAVSEPRARTAIRSPARGARATPTSATTRRC